MPTLETNMFAAVSEGSVGAFGTVIMSENLSVSCGKDLILGQTLHTTVNST